MAILFGTNLKLSEEDKILHFLLFLSEKSFSGLHYREEAGRILVIIDNADIENKSKKSIEDGSFFQQLRSDISERFPDVITMDKKELIPYKPDAISFTTLLARKIVAKKLQLPHFFQLILIDLIEATHSFNRRTQGISEYIKQSFFETMQAFHRLSQYSQAYVNPMNQMSIMEFQHLSMRIQLDYRLSHFFQKNDLRKEEPWLELFNLIAKYEKTNDQDIGSRLSVPFCYPMTAPKIVTEFAKDNDSIRVILEAIDLPNDIQQKLKDKIIRTDVLLLAKELTNNIEEVSICIEQSAPSQALLDLNVGVIGDDEEIHKLISVLQRSLYRTGLGLDYKISSMRFQMKRLELTNEVKQENISIISKYKINFFSNSDPSHALHQAVVKNQLADVLSLIKISGIINSQDKDPLSNKTALHLAVTKGTTDCMKILLEAGARYDIPDASGRTAVDYANELKNTAFLDLLAVAISKQVSIDAKPYNTISNKS